MYPYFVLWQNQYYIDSITPILMIIGFVIIVYLLSKKQWLRFRDISSRLPFIIITTIIIWNYAHLALSADSLIPIWLNQFGSLFMISLSWFDFIWLIIGFVISVIWTIKSFGSKAQDQWSYVFIVSVLLLLIPAGVLYVLGDTIIGKANDGFFSIWSFMTESRINQLGTNVYPFGLLISLLATLCVWLIRILYIRYPKIHYRSCAWFMFLYMFILHYQDYTRNLVISIWSIQFDLRSYISLLVSWIIVYFWYNSKPLTRFKASHHEDSIWETR